VTLVNPATSVLSVLSQVAQNATAALNQQRLQLIQTDLTNSYQTKITAAQALGNPTPAQNAEQAQINTLTEQATVFNTAETQYGTNANVFANMSAQLTTLQTAASAGDSQTFDITLSQAISDVDNLRVVGFNPVFQNDGVATLKGAGLGIRSSSSYNLATSQGKAAALAAIAQAQQQVSASATATTQNQSEAGTQVQALSQIINTLTASLQQSQVAQITESTQQVADLQQQLQNQLHLVELNLGNSSAAVQALRQEQTAVQSLYAAPQPGTLLSLFA